MPYPSTRSAFGEMHNRAHPANKGKTFPRYKLGEDVLVEAYIFFPYKLLCSRQQ